MSYSNRPTPRTPGYNVDRIDVAAGLRELKTCGYNEPETIMVIEYALMRWARGEEESAQRGAIDRSFHGINLTSWIRVLAAARAHAEIAKPRKMVEGASYQRKRYFDSIRNEERKTKRKRKAKV